MPILPPPPPAITVPPPPVAGNERRLLAWMPGEVRCGGSTVAAAPMRRPWTNIVWGQPAMKPVTYAFSIDTSGRTLDIRRRGDTGYVSFGDDLAPSLAATRFAGGETRGDCAVTYTPQLTAFADTPVADLLSYTVTPLSGALPEQGWARIRALGNCAAPPRPEPLLAAYPDYRALPGTAGVKDWTLVGYDLDARGRPKGVHVAAGTGNAALDAAAMKAMAASRFTTGTPRHGCLYPYWHAPATLAPPPVPEEAAFRPADATCPSNHDWSRYPTLTFPEAYRRRSIEGWAVVVYDVAPWGEVGNVRIVASQPTEEFGTQALTVIRSARVATTQGLIGCVDKVRFAMGPTDGGGTTAPPSAE